jgi:hypothetical protein
LQAPHFGISRGLEDRFIVFPSAARGNRSKGLAEREGFRTLGTGVSPYNGLASVSIYAVYNHIMSLQSGQRLENG